MSVVGKITPRPLWSTVPRRSFAAALAALSLLCGLAIAFATVVLVVKGQIPAPIEDQWDQLVTGHDVTWRWLLSAHNEHRIVLPRLVFLLDRLLSRERNTVDLAINVLIQASVSVLFVSVFRRGSHADAIATALFAGLVIALEFWMVQWENFIWGFQVQFFGVVLGALATFHLVAFTRRTWSALAGILLAMSCTVLTLASGIVAALLAVPLAIRVGRPRRDVVAMGATAAALLLFELNDFRSLPAAVGAIDPTARLGAIVAHAIVDVGGPIGSGLAVVTGCDPVIAAACAGTAGLGLLAILAGRDLAAPSAPARLVVVSIGSFSFLAAVLTATGRWTLGLSQALSSRYATPAVAFWIALAILIHDETGRSRARSPALSWVLPTCLLALAGASQSAFSAIAEEESNARAAALPAMAAGVADRTALGAIRSDVGPALGRIPLLKAAETSLFADPRLRLKGERLLDRMKPVAAAQCKGSLAEASPLEGTDPSGWRVAGTVQVADLARQQWLAITDPSGIVVGYGIVPPFETASSGGVATEWTGDVDLRGATVLTPYVLLPDDRACPLDESGAMFHPQAALAPLPAGAPAPMGWVDDLSSDGGLTITGWAGIGGDGGRTKDLFLDTNLPVAAVTMKSVARPDVADGEHDPRLSQSGWQLTLTMNAPLPAAPRLCIWSRDPVFGTHVVPNAVRPDLCPEPALQTVGRP